MTNLIRVKVVELVQSATNYSKGKDVESVGPVASTALGVMSQYLEAGDQLVRVATHVLGAVVVWLTVVYWRRKIDSLKK